MFADVFAGQLAKHFTALIRKLQRNQVLLRLVDLRPCIFQILTGKVSNAFLILKFQQGCLADHFDCFFRIFYSRQFNDDPALALTLDDRLGQAEFINSLFDDLENASDRILIHFCLGCVDSFQNHMRAALQIKTLLD